MQSTLASSLLRFTDPDSGAIIIDGVRSDLALRTKRGQILTVYISAARHHQGLAH